MLHRHLANVLLLGRAAAAAAVQFVAAELIAQVAEHALATAAAAAAAGFCRRRRGSPQRCTFSSWVKRLVALLPIAAAIAGAPATGSAPAAKPAKAMVVKRTASAVVCVRGRRHRMCHEAAAVDAC
jgi:nitrate reductase gamma subunit